MSANTVPIFPAVLKNAVQTFVNADGTGVYKALAVAGTNGSKIESIAAVSTDTAAKVIQLAIQIAAVNYPIGEFTVAIGAGTNGGTTKAGNLLNTTDLPFVRTDENGRAYIYLAPGSSLVGSIETTAVTAAKQVTVFAQGGDF